MTSNAAGDQQNANAVDPMKQTMLIIEHKIRNLEKRKLKLEGYLQQQNEGAQLSDDQLLAASKFNEVVSTLDFARNLKKQLNAILTASKQKKNNTEPEKLPTKVDNKIKEVLIFQNIFESIKDEKVKQDLLTGNNGAVQLTDEELTKLSNFSKMVLPKRRVEEGKPLFEDQLKTVSKHYMKLIDSKPNIVVGTSYANLKECLLKIEKSGYLDHVIKSVDEEVITANEINNVETKVLETVNEPISFINDSSLDNEQVSSIPSAEYTSNKIETIYFTNNKISGNPVEQNPRQNKSATDSAFNTSFDFLQDSQLEDDHLNVNLNSIPTQTFSSSLYSNNLPTDDAILKILPTPPPHLHRAMGPTPYKEPKLNRLENIVNVTNSSSWAGGKPVSSEVSWQNRSNAGDRNNLPRENWSMAQIIGNSANSDWFIKNNWVQMAEADKQSNQQPQPPQPTQSSTKTSSTNFGLATNGYSENLNELLQKSVVFNKQESYPVVTTSSNTSTFYHNNYGQQSHEQNMGHYTNSNSNYDRNHHNDFNKRSTASMKPRSSYTGEGEQSRGYQQGNSYIYNNRSYKNSSNQYNTNAHNDFSRISRQT